MSHSFTTSSIYYWVCSHIHSDCAWHIFHGAWKGKLVDAQGSMFEDHIHRHYLRYFDHCSKGQPFTNMINIPPQRILNTQGKSSHLLLKFVSEDQIIGWIDQQLKSIKFPQVTMQNSPSAPPSFCYSCDTSCISALRLEICFVSLCTNPLSCKVEQKRAWHH